MARKPTPKHQSNLPQRTPRKMNKPASASSQSKEAGENINSQTRGPGKAKQNQARNMFDALVHVNPIPTALNRLEDRATLDVNDAFLAYFGLQREEVIGQNLEKLGIGLEAQEHTGLLARVRNEGTIRNYEVEALHTSGERRNIIMSLQYVNIDNTDAIISTFIDITDRIRAEAQIRALASELTVTEQAERHRIAQILHDDLQQRIFAVQMQLSFLQDAYEKNDLKAFEVDFPQLETWLAEAISVTRQLSVDLSPPVLHGEGLLEAILWLAAQMEEQYGLKVHIKSNGKLVQLDEKMRIMVFYTTRELLFNVVKHAGILEAFIDFEHSDHHLRVVVSDKGKGFNSAEVMNNPKVAHGLLRLRYRLRLLGCSMEVKSEPGNGTKVTVGVPYEQPGI